MNDETPSPFPPTSPKPEKPRGESREPYDAPNFWLMFGLGVLLLIVSCLLCAPTQSPVPFIGGAVLASTSLGFRGYRGIFAGFLATIGLVFLVLIIICGNSMRGI
jgi:hypothetical protein